MGAGSGDKLARGAAKAQFAAGGSKKTDVQWENMFRNENEQLPEVSGGNSDASQTGDAGSNSGKTE